MWVDREGRRRVPPKERAQQGVYTPAWDLPVVKSKYVLDESDEEVQRTPLYSPPKRRPEENGFYMPGSPFAKVAEAEGLDFNADKKVSTSSSPAGPRRSRRPPTTSSTSTTRGGGGRSGSR